MFQKVAIANRGAVAVRLISTLREMGVESLLLCSEADLKLPYVGGASKVEVLGPAAPRESYLNQERVIQAAKKLKAEAIHPGWGFLSEDAEFARKVISEGLAFIGPSPECLAIMGHKVSARKKMAELGLPISPSTEELTGTPEEKAQKAKAIGFPLMIKPAGGGGGIGMIPVTDEEKLLKALETAESQALRGFGSGSVYAEKLIVNPRHVEFQVVADKKGAARHLWERDCSIQRRRQKILEEAGAPNIERAALSAMAQKSAEVLSKLNYDHLGTVETLYDGESGFNFLEVNPRLQVEHAVTEKVSGVNLVAAQIRLAMGEGVDEILSDYGWPPQPGSQAGLGSGSQAGHQPGSQAGLEKGPQGHALEARIYAEDPVRFLPSPGKITVFRPPAGRPGLTIITPYGEGCEVTPFYDPMIAQVIVHTQDRLGSLKMMSEVLAEFEVAGIKTNIGFLRLMMEFGPYVAGNLHTGLADELVASENYKARLEALKC
ncbi:MAG: biotin carboxylase [Deltaproteobacteria bacterium]|jgi:acetyl-CoA carboxylase biotin carboxylase subunit|nr:biotin carboxylase [Deltaproteobacteria bacterium]